MKETEQASIRLMVDEVGKLLQKIEELVAQNDDVFEEANKIRFPRGYFKKVADIEREISFVENSNLRKNIAYALQYADLLKWVLGRFDIDFSILSIHNKTGLVLLGSIAEGLLKGVKSGCRGGFEALIKCIGKKNMISPELAKELKWLKKQRNYIHLDLISIRERSREYDREGPKYKPEDFKRGLNIIAWLIRELEDPPLQF